MITFIRTNFSNPDLHRLIVELDKEFVVRYPFIENIRIPFNLLNESARVVVAYDHTTPVACGAFRPVDESTIEIKRMYTMPSYRNKGIGKKLLHELEHWAHREGYTASILETGINQPEAIAAYEKSGYTRIPNFPPYVDVKESICMRKYL
jgi:GNAT superfamily N-acetyltransferase